MIAKAMTAAALLLAAAAATASPTPADSPEVRIPLMHQFLEWHADGHRGVYIRAANGRWYYARTMGECPRLRDTAAVRFNAKNNELDRFGALHVDGWRCPLASVTESDAPPNHRRRHGRK